LRRALAREGLRAGGRELRGRGDPALAPWRARLGTVPDAEIAREAHVAIEAVQGERRRLGVPPFSVGGPVRLTADEEAWIRGPEPFRRVRQRPADTSASLEVVRRPRSGTDSARARLRSEEAPPPVAAWPLPSPVGASSPPPRRVSPAFFRTHEPADLDRLLQPLGAPRDGASKRIVRIEPARSAPEPPPTAQVHPEARRPLQAPPPAVSAPRAFVTPPPARPPARPAPLPARAQRVAPAAPPQRWHVLIPGEAAPMIVHADTAWGAARVASTLLPPHLWAQVSLVLAGADTAGLLAWRDVPTFG
jgi:hypothetical protein